MFKNTKIIKYLEYVRLNSMRRSDLKKAFLRSPPYDVIPIA